MLLNFLLSYLCYREGWTDQTKGLSSQRRKVAWTISSRKTTCKSVSFCTYVYSYGKGKKHPKLWGIQYVKIIYRYIYMQTLGLRLPGLRFLKYTKKTLALGCVQYQTAFQQKNIINENYFEKKKSCNQTLMWTCSLPSGLLYCK